MIVVAAVVPQFNLDPRDDAVRRKTQRSIGRRFQHLDEASRPLAANAVSAGDGHRCNRLMRPVSSVSADGVFIVISTPWSRDGLGDHAASKMTSEPELLSANEIASSEVHSQTQCVRKCPTSSYDSIAYLDDNSNCWSRIKARSRRKLRFPRVP